MTADELLAPITLTEFLDRYWEAQPLHISGRDQSNYDNLVQIAEIDGFLSRTDVRHPSVRLVKNGSEVRLDAYTRELRIGGHKSHDQIINDRLFSEYSSGSTIILQQLQDSIPGFGVFTNALENTFSCNVHASAFITPKAAQGFTAHCDTYSFFALQISGEKRWNLYDRTPLLPIRDDRIDEKPWSPVEPTQQLVMRSGDLLYVPRGVFHDAETSDQPSIHITVGFFSPNWIDVTKAALAEASFRPELRAAVQVGGSGLGIFKAAEAAISELDLSAGLRKLQDFFVSRRVDVRIGRLLDALSEQEWTSETRFRIHPHLDFSIRADEGKQRVGIAFAGKEVLLPIFVAPTLSLMSEQTSFTIRELGSALNEISAQTLCKRLVREGFLTVAR